MFSEKGVSPGCEDALSWGMPSVGSATVSPALSKEQVVSFGAYLMIIG